MHKKVVFIHGASLRRLEDPDKRRKIRSDVIKAARRQAKVDRDKARADNTSALWPVYDPRWSPASWLSASRADPFLSVGLEPHDFESHEIFDYCVRDLWLEFRPGTSYAVEFARAWFPRAAASPVVMAAILYSASVHQNMRRLEDGQSVEVSVRHLRLKGAAIASIRESLARAETLSKDHVEELIYSILCMASNSNSEIGQNVKPDNNNFDSPFVGAQWVDLYAKIDADPTHFAAIVALVNSKGGIQTLRSYSVGWLVHFAALMGAANSMGRSVYPPLSMNGHETQFKDPLRLIGVSDTPFHLTRPLEGFHIFHDCELGGDIVQTFLDISELSQAIDICLQKGDKSKLMVFLDDRADLLHRLLNSPASFDEFAHHIDVDSACDIERWFQLYNVTRSASLLYMLHVIFPLPRSRLVRNQTIPAIMRICSWFSVRSLSTREMMLLLWSSLLAAIATDDQKDQSTLLQYVDAYSTGLRIDAYSQLCEILRLFGWIGPACDRSAVMKWTTRKGNRMIGE